MKVPRLELRTLWFRMPKNERHKPLRHAAVNVLDGLYLLGTLSRLGISFPNGNYFI